MEVHAERQPAPRLDPGRLMPRPRRQPETSGRADLKLRRPLPSENAAVATEAPAAVPLNERSLGEEIHPLCYRVAFGSALWIVCVYGLSFLAAPHAFMMVVISLGFMVMYGGLPFVMWRSRRGPAKAGRFAVFAQTELPTWTGVLHGREAAVQIMTVPLALAVAATGIALAIAGAR